MPVRIKPVHDLGPCILTLESIKGICTLMDKEFGDVSFTAEDDIWTVYNEPSGAFLPTIVGRDKLDTFIAEAPPPSLESGVKIEAASIERIIIGAEQSLIGLPTTTIASLGVGTGTSNAHKSIRLVFSKEEAKVIFDISPDNKHWLDHFMLDLRKHINAPSFLQRFGGLPIPIVFVSGAVVVPIQQPYCRIILKPRQPNQRRIGIGDNIAANVIYDIMKLVLGAIIGIIALWLLNQFGIDILGSVP